MSKRFDVCTPRPKRDGGTFWHRVGTAFDGEKGMTLYLDSLPLQDDKGKCVLMLFEPRNMKEPGAQGPGPASQTGSDPSDKIPF